MSDLSPLQGMRLTGLDCVWTNVSDLSPLKGMPLTRLECHSTQVSDLSPLEGMRLTRLMCFGTLVSDLSPLRGMPLTELGCWNTNTSDLSPLQRMPLTLLGCSHTRVSAITPLMSMQLTSLSCDDTMVSDLSPLHGMPLTTLNCDNTPVSDLSPLAGMNLTSLAFTPGRITKGLDAIRQMKGVTGIGTAWDKLLPPAEFWRKYDAGEFAKAEDTKGPAAASPTPAKAPFDAKGARAYQEAWAKYLGRPVETTNSIGMKMVLLPPGEFLMGSTDEQVEAAIKTAIQRGDEKWGQDRIRDAERPQHKVVLTKPLAMGATVVTIGQFRRFIEATKNATLAETFGGDSDSTDPNHPGNKDHTWRHAGLRRDR